MNHSLSGLRPARRRHALALLRRVERLGPGEFATVGPSAPSWMLDAVHDLEVCGLVEVVRTGERWCRVFRPECNSVQDRSATNG